LEQESQEERHEAIRVPSGAASGSSPTGLIPGARESKLSRYFLLWLPVAPFVGFTLAEAVFDLGADGDWELWKAALLGAGCRWLRSLSVRTSVCVPS
jgi:hypothetical protein